MGASRILVTGAGGRTGRAVCAELLRRETGEVWAVDASEHLLVDLVQGSKGEIRDVLCNVRDWDRLRLCLVTAKPFAVIHSARLGASALADRFPAEFLLTNVVGLANTLCASLDAGVVCFVWTGSPPRSGASGTEDACRALAEGLLALVAEFNADCVYAVLCRGQNELNFHGIVRACLETTSGRVLTGGQRRRTDSRGVLRGPSPPAPEDFVLSAVLTGALEALADEAVDDRVRNWIKVLLRRYGFT